VNDSAAELTIGDVATRTGLGEGTLRMWEVRYDFPTPRRLPSGHRRYTTHDLDEVLAVLRAREQGMSLPSAIARARRLQAEPRGSLYTALRADYEHLTPHRLGKPTLLRLTRAIEDECCARALRPLLFACFQHERFYRQSEQRWRELARSASRAIVLADFSRTRRPRHAPAEVPIGEREPVAREWVVVCDAPEVCACLVGWERPPIPGEERRFETIWTVEPDVVREAARICRDLVAARAPELVEDLRDRLEDAPASGGPAQLRAAVAIATRVALYAAGEPGA
jgi:MerR family transcriptional regulator, light-induced transcriptional regulator